MASQVLIVEDHPLVAEATARLIELARAIQPVLSSDAESTRRLLDQKGDVWFRIFLDLDIPGAYGLSLAREIKDRGLAGRTCVVSASDKSEYVDEVRRWGFLGYIAKAIPVAEFETSIRRILDGKAAFPEVATSHRAWVSLPRSSAGSES